MFLPAKYDKENKEVRHRRSGFPTKTDRLLVYGHPRSPMGFRGRGSKFGVPIDLQELGCCLPRITLTYDVVQLVLAPRSY